MGERVALPYLRAWREYRGLPQRALGDQAWVSDLEHGIYRAQAGSVRKLARALGITPETLVRSSPPRKD